MKRMVPKIVLVNFSILIAFLILTGCGLTKEQALDYAKESFEVGVLEEPQEPNEATDLFSYYLPSELIVEEKAENNLILGKDNQVFLIFSNPAETKLSQVNYEQDRVVENTALLVETTEVDGKFAYIIVSPFEDDDYKVIVGIGGEKGTTVTNLANLKDSVDTLLEIINSINY
ncbi:MAG: hypothetical protein ACK4M9_07345 [Anaerobacillus sp.]|uniref:hypothetical protein n=1 Tax=Anaerobacillus sp. TaxID=1872506 RepID=UPI003918CD33